MAEALKFYQEELGFSVVWQSAEMAGIQRGSVSFNLVENQNREWALNASFSIGVANLDALYEEYRHIAVPVSPPKQMPWGRRELHLIVPSGVCLQFYDQAG